MTAVNFVIFMAQVKRELTKGSEFSRLNKYYLAYFGRFITKNNKFQKNTGRKDENKIVISIIASIK